MKIAMMALVLIFVSRAACGPLTAPLLTDSETAQFAHPADISASAYQYRADRNPDENAPESWLAVMRFAGQPLNKPAKTTAPAVKQVLSALLWEEIRPVQQMELIWPADAKRRPAPEEVVITTLDSQGSASSWWNNLKAVAKPACLRYRPIQTLGSHELKDPTCGIVISVKRVKTGGGLRRAAGVGAYWLPIPGKRWTSKSNGRSIRRPPTRTTAGELKRMMEG